MHQNPYQRFHAELSAVVPASRLITDSLRTLAYGTDASFYRLIPKIVVKADTEAEVSAVLRQAASCGVPVTFRAAGTSLSGQAVSDSVLLVAGEAWKRMTVEAGGARIRLQPGVIGGHVNLRLAPFGRKLGPDPASINAAMIGGIAANNASGMCCGTAQNSYQTVRSIRIVLADGTVLDTGDPESCAAFRHTHAPLLERLTELARRVQGDAALAGRIRKKFSIKNTTGYSLNALVDFTDPFEIITHLMIGSEGTLAFISEIVYDTVPAPPFKATALLLFPEIQGACAAAEQMQRLPVAAAEVMDRAALRSVERKPGMPAAIRGLPDATTALLVESQAADFDTLSLSVKAIAEALSRKVKPSNGPGGAVEWELVNGGEAMPARFTTDAAQSDRLWQIRKGLLPSVGAVRQTGSTVLIEDVAFPIHHLPAATLDLQDLFRVHRYTDAIIFGHALAGNLHFVFPQQFGTREEVDRYARFMDDVCRMVVERYDGSLKAEHGTGRNMAPYVEMEWGRDAYRIMTEIKEIFDPRHLLNPGVILNPDPRAHLKHLKPLPPADPLIDKCIECGFCECHCPSRNLTLTPRHRIVVQREIARLSASGEDSKRLKELAAGYAYQGEATCAADGLCGLACPVEINTGTFTKTLRHRQRAGAALQRRIADQAADRFHAVTTGVRLGLEAADLLRKTVGSDRLARWSGAVRTLSRGRVPSWHRFLPAPAPAPVKRDSRSGGKETVVYFPSCVSRTMGPAPGDPDDAPLHRVTRQVLERAGYRVIHPEGMERLCCGLPFESKGFFDQADRKSDELEAALAAASRGGAFPILCDTSPCLERMRRVFSGDLMLFEPVAFTAAHLLERLTFKRVARPVALHITCSARKMGLNGDFLAVARACAETVVVPEGIECCGFAGDRGFSYPELNASALAPLRAAVAGCAAGYSNSRTCEIGLSLHSGIHYRSILYLVEQCTRAR